MPNTDSRVKQYTMNQAKPMKDYKIVSKDNKKKKPKKKKKKKKTKKYKKK